MTRLTEHQKSILRRRWTIDGKELPKQVVILPVDPSDDWPGVHPITAPGLYGLLRRWLRSPYRVYHVWISATDPLFFGVGWLHTMPCVWERYTLPWQELREFLYYCGVKYDSIEVDWKKEGF